jgi:Icc protein
MRIAFITDLHIGAEGEKPNDVDVRQNFLEALAYLPQIKPSCLVLGGDLCLQTGDQAVYSWIRQQLDALPYPYRVIVGNHDNAAMLAEVFDLTHHLHGNELYYALPLEGRPALFLDSSSGEFSSVQWAWLHDYMDALRGNNLLVFMHHPPLPADVAFMDSRYPFRQSDKFLEMVRDLPCHVTVVCGHYHVEKVVQRGNLLTLLTPSTFFQMKHDPTDMVIDNLRIGVREINLTSHGTNSTVHYV